jgi:hypothetical protein
LSDTEAGLFAAAGCGLFALIAVGGLIIQILILVWVHKDAKARGMDTPVLWMIVVFFLSLLGLVVYLLARPSGEKVPCRNCGNPRLMTLVRCPHCGSD